jgi:hypothetical protein
LLAEFRFGTAREVLERQEQQPHSAAAAPVHVSVATA